MSTAHCGRCLLYTSTEGNQSDVHRQPALLALTPVDNNSEEIAPTEEMQALLTHWYTISEVDVYKRQYLGRQNGGGR